MKDELFNTTSVHGLLLVSHINAAELHALHIVLPLQSVLRIVLRLQSRSVGSTIAIYQ